MKQIGRVLFWRYHRGSWQYDILCALILAFIFLTPKEVFQGKFFADQTVEDDDSNTGKAEKDEHSREAAQGTVADRP